MNANGVARVEELWVYPLKSAAGISLDRMELEGEEFVDHTLG